MADLSNVRFRKSERAASKEFIFDADMLKLFMTIDGQKTVREVSTEVRLGPAAFKENFIKLLKLGLIEQADDGEALVSKAFIDDMRETLIQLIGPLGGMLVDDTAEDMGWPANRIPLSGLAALVGAVAKEIPGNKQSLDFRKRMIKKMKDQGL
jgi:hypothetical protein